MPLSSDIKLQLESISLWCHILIWVNCFNKCYWRLTPTFLPGLFSSPLIFSCIETPLSNMHFPAMVTWRNRSSMKYSMFSSARLIAKVVRWQGSNQEISIQPLATWLKSMEQCGNLSWNESESHRSLTYCNVRSVMFSLTLILSSSSNLSGPDRSQSWSLTSK